jgi:Protein of unknown function (DUF1254)
VRRDRSVLRQNRDTLYSSAVFDLDAGPVTITLPDPGNRFMSMQLIDEDEYTHDVIYGKGLHTISREQIGTRYVATPVRILVNPNDPVDVSAVHALQNAIVVKQENIGAFDVPKWDPVSQKTVRDALVALGDTLPNAKGTFGSKQDTDPVRHLIGAANAWGGNPEKDALYLTVVPTAEQWHHRAPVDGRRGAGGRVLVGHRLQQGRVLLAEPAKRIGAARLGHEHDGADGLAALQIAVGLLGVFEPVVLAHRNVDGSRRDRIEQFSCTPREFIGSPGVMVQIGPGQEH